MATLPTFPTDSLYKFVALFGLVLVGFSLWYPEDRFIKSDGKVRETMKAQELNHIKVARKTERAKDLLEELDRRRGLQDEKQKAIDEAQAALDSKHRAVQEELDGLLKGTKKGDVEGAKSRAEAFTAEINLMNENIRTQIVEVRKLTEDYKACTTRQEEVSDELAGETVEAKSFTKELEALNEQAKGWLATMIAGLVWGFIMIIGGFTLWYRRVQVYQDKILRRQAEPTGGSSEKVTASD